MLPTVLSGIGTATISENTFANMASTRIQKLSESPTHNVALNGFSWSTLHDTETTLPNITQQLVLTSSGTQTKYTTIKITDPLDTS